MTDAPAIKGDKGADAGADARTMNAQASLDLRSTIGHARAQAHTADATSAMPAAGGQVTMSDARPSNADMSAQAPASEPVKAEADKGGNAKTDDAAGVKAEAPATEAAKAEETKALETKAPEVAPAAKSETATTTPAVAPDFKKDPARLPGAEKAVATKPEPPRRPGQIAVFVSRKDSKLYVRENFKPQFSVPVTIAPGDRPLGTHVFTAETDKSDPNLLRWSVVSLPARHVARADEDQRVARRKIAGGVLTETRPLSQPNSPAEALDRISIPQDAMTRIAELLITGSSIVVSDLGIAQGGETGEGTDFIVPLR
jgi:hypothetical protein